MMTAEQIKAELTALDERIAHPGDLTHAFAVSELKNVKWRREQLQAELKRVSATKET
jgi:hypothetical protein